MKKLNVNFESVKIKILCSANGNEHSLGQLLNETSPLVDGYTKTHDNAIFQCVWHDRLKDLSSESSLAVADIQTKIWKPVIQKCMELLRTLQQCTMTLTVVDRYFSQFKCTPESLLKHLTHLFYSLSEYCTTSDDEEDFRKIKEGVAVILQYWSLSTYADAAQICLHLKEELKLEGDFQMVEMLAKQVNLFLLCALKMQ